MVPLKCIVKRVFSCPVEAFMEHNRDRYFKEKMILAVLLKGPADNRTLYDIALMLQNISIIIASPLTMLMV